MMSRNLSNLETGSQSSILSSLRDYQLQSSRDSRKLAHIDHICNRSPGPCYNPGAETFSTRMSAAARKAQITERQNETMRRNMEREARLRQNKDRQQQEKDEYKRQKKDKMENDKEKLRRKLARDESISRLAQEKNEAKQQRVAQHRQNEVTRITSARNKITTKYEESDEITRRHKENHEVKLLAKAMQRDLKMQESANERATQKEMREKKLADKQAAEEDRVTKRVEAALSVRQSLGPGSSTAGTPRESPLPSPRGGVGPSPLLKSRPPLPTVEEPASGTAANGGRSPQVKGGYPISKLASNGAKSTSKDVVDAQQIELFMSVYKSNSCKAEEISRNLICKPYQTNECTLGPECNYCHICATCHKNDMVVAHPACAQDCWSKLGLLGKG